MARLPVRQVAHPKLITGEIFVADVDGQKVEFWPKWANEQCTVLAEEVGLLARVPNPLNSSRTLTICDGIHSRGICPARTACSSVALMPLCQAVDGSGAKGVDDQGV